MYCSKCGNKVNDEDRFCDRCGFCLNSNGLDKKESNDKERNWSLILCIIACCLILNPIVSLPLSVIAVILGVRNRKKFGNVGIVIGGINIILSVVQIVVLMFVLNDIYNYLGDFFNDIYNNYEIIEDEILDISNSSYLVNDNSIIDFNNDGSYYWYYNNDLDNYNRGDYEFYVGDQAYNYFVDNLEGDISVYYGMDNFCLIVMNPVEIMADGVIVDRANTVYYYGSYDEDSTELINYNTSNSLSLVLYNEKSIGVDI